MRSFLAGTLLTVALLVAGCGGSGGSPAGSTNSSGNGEASKSGKQVLTDAVQAAKDASSFRMSGDVNTGSQQIGLDLTIVKGKGATGSMTLKGQKVDLMIVGTNAYMKADAAFWRQFGGSSGSTIAQLVAGKWFKFPTTNPQFGALAEFANSSVLDGLASTTGTITNKGATTYHGENVVALDGGRENGTLYVAGTGTPYPVAIAKTGGSSGGAIVFDNWNESVTLTAPSGAIDISQLHP